MTSGNIKGLYEWLLSERKVSEETAKKYILAISKPYKETALSQKAYRLLTKYLAQKGEIREDFADKILKLIKIKHVNADLYVPTTYFYTTS